MKYSKKDIEEARKFLHEFLKPAKITRDGHGNLVTKKPGTIVHTILRSVSRSGMSRRISCFVPYKGDMINITYAVARVLGEPYDNREGSIRVTGCGMDMGFHIVSNLSYALYGKDKKGNYKPDGGYFLGHRWM